MKKSDELYVLELELYSINDKFKVYESMEEAEQARDKIMNARTNIFGINIFTLTEFIIKVREEINESFHSWNEE